MCRMRKAISPQSVSSLFPQYVVQFLGLAGCHKPPTTDQELISRVSAQKKGDPKNGLVAWRCIFCLTANAPDTFLEPKTTTPNDAILTANEPDVIEISDSESSPPPPLPAEVVSLVSSDDEEIMERFVFQAKKDTTRNQDWFDDLWDTIQSRLSSQMEPSAAAPGRHFAPRTYEAPPWFDRSSSSTDAWDELRNSTATASTSSAPHPSRKPKGRPKANIDTFNFSLTSWMEARKPGEISKSN